MKKVIIVRDWQDNNQTLGRCTVYNEDSKPIFAAISLERGWRQNKNRISCVPGGEYPLVLEYSPRFKKNLWELKKVPNKAECKIHPSNYWFELEGCISLGLKLKDLNGDGYNDVTNSKDTVNAFHTALKGEKEAKLIIIDRI